MTSLLKIGLISSGTAQKYLNFLDIKITLGRKKFSKKFRQKLRQCQEIFLTKKSKKFLGRFLTLKESII